MKIHGLQKMTLLDFPGRVACTVFLGGCDMRCPFCHNAELIDGSAEAIMDETELLAFLEKRKGLLDGVAFTGGEPTLRKDLPDLFRRIKAMGYPIKLDTNGLHPDRLKALLDEGLVDYVAMDIKNCPEKYAVTAGLETVDLDKIQQSIDLLKNGTVDYEFRTTVVDELHKAEDFEKIGAWIAGARAYYLQAFTDRDTVVFENLHAPSREKMEAYAYTVRKFVPNTALRGI
ncbi:MAG: anaerobic ribonucleoside-triphosphate reductase activating protein [Clostridia bacterium]|nr:anaerobic ribonucleoside-triphosphate reductase activating protein [Clostridia bacterium]